MSITEQGSKKRPTRQHQRIWRLVGGVAIVVCALMAWFGVDLIKAGVAPLALFAYWSVFLALLLVALYVVLLDIRYIRLEYALGEREIFKNTFESEEFQQAIRKAIEEERRQKTPDQKE